MRRDQRAEGVEDRLPPRRHLLRLRARQVTELLAADGVQRPEDDNPAVLMTLHHRFETCAERERGLAGAGPTAQGDDADVGVEQQVERDALLRATPVYAECFAVAADEANLLVRRDPTQRMTTFGKQHETGVTRQLAGVRDVEYLVCVQRVDLGTSDFQLRHTRPAGLDLL